MRLLLPFAAAFSSHVSTAPAFLPAAASSFALQLLAVGVPVLPSIAPTRSLTKLSTVVSVVPAVIVPAQSPRCSALA
jgi:hypothetical protein